MKTWEAVDQCPHLESHLDERTYAGNTDSATSLVSVQFADATDDDAGVWVRARMVYGKATAGAASMEADCGCEGNGN